PVVLTSAVAADRNGSAPHEAGFARETSGVATDHLGDFASPLRDLLLEGEGVALGLQESSTTKAGATGTTPREEPHRSPESPSSISPGGAAILVDGKEQSYGCGNTGVLEARSSAGRTPVRDAPTPLPTPTVGVSRTNGREGEGVNVNPEKAWNFVMKDGNKLRAEGGGAVAPPKPDLFTLSNLAAEECKNIHDDGVRLP
ncbi:unnamed protein product, partial [Pylaiella littoralis]